MKYYISKLQRFEFLKPVIVTGGFETSIGSVRKFIWPTMSLYSLPQGTYTYVYIFYLLYYLPLSVPLTTIKQRMRAIFMSIRLVIVVDLRYQRAICRPSSSAKYPISEMFNWPPYCSPGFLLWSTKKQQIIHLLRTLIHYI